MHACPVRASVVHAVARPRTIDYQYSVVMKYLDNLIAWGDSLFMQDTIESINYATQIYVRLAKLLGLAAQRVPARGTVQAETYASLRAKGYDKPVIALTAHASIEHRQLALEAGCDYYLSKPINTSSLVEILRKSVRPAAKETRPEKTADL